MAFDLAILGSKLSRYRDQFQGTIDDVATGTGIPFEVLVAYENGTREPTGDDILILADYYKCDYKFFVSNEQLAPFEQTETLFRKHGDALSTDDRWAIQEFLFLCECEEFLLGVVPVLNRKSFTFQKHGSYQKQHGKDAAKALRSHLGFKANQLATDIFRDFRSIGLHVFRRKLANSAISGLFVRHPIAGPCLMINFSEDVYRQRFTAAHEAGHAILDDGSDVNVSFDSENRGAAWGKSDLSEIRANTFASHFLMPPEFLLAVPDPKQWPVSKAIEWASRLKVSTTALAIALKDAGLITDTTVQQLKSVAVPADAKVDAELLVTLSPASRSRKLDMLKRGLSSFYVDLCFRAYREDAISAGRLAEMLLVPPQDVHSVAKLYGEELAHGD